MPSSAPYSVPDRSATIAPVPFERLLEWASALDERRFSPLADPPFLLFAADPAGAAAPELDRVADWLSRLPCPSIAVAATPIDNAASRAADVRLDRAADALPLIDNIRRSPVAASVLVQVLRCTAVLSIEDALTVESLAYASLQSGAEYQRWLAQHRSIVPIAVADAGPPVLIRRDGDALHIALNRPANRNAISVEMRDALNEALALVAVDDSIAGARVSGIGRCFSVGGDLSEFGRVPDPASGHVIRALSLPARQLLRCGDRIRFHLHGACVGAGIELPAFASRVMAAADAWFQLPELRFGLIPGAGGCVSIPRRIGRQRAAWLALSGKRIGAAQALAWGLVDAVT